ncbi:MAG: UbiA prenyltransferase family protein [Actinobacteria bacterium]|nr:UbiA prenyltransferase family protein [Actinomycetota bacterium]
MKGRVGRLLDFAHAPHALLSVTQPALGALLAAQGFPERRTMYLGAAAATAGMLCVYPLNDLLHLQTHREEAKSLVLLDEETEHHADGARVRHPLAQGAVPVWLGVSWVIGTGLTGFTLATRLRRGCGVIFLGCVGLEAVYCALRRRTWLKIIPAGSVVGLGGLAGWYAVRGFDTGAVAYFVLLSFWEIFGRNVANDLADLALDAPIGIRTIATTHGPAWSARACLVGSIATVLVTPMQRGPIRLRLPLTASAVWTMALPALRLHRQPSEGEAQRYFDRASLFPPLAFLAAATFFLLRRERAGR